MQTQGHQTIPMIIKKIEIKNKKEQRGGVKSNNLGFISSVEEANRGKTPFRTQKTVMLRKKWQGLV